MSVKKLFPKGSLTQQSTKRMTSVERELIFRVADNDQRLFLTLGHWWHMTEFVGALCWCVDNHLTGKNLYEWLKIPPHDGILNSYGFILGRLRKDKKIYTIHYGKEYR